MKAKIKTCFKVDNINDGLKSVVRAFDGLINLNEEDNIVTITKPIKKQLANALRGCCKDIVTNIDGILEDAYMIFDKTELCKRCTRRSLETMV